MSVQRLARVSLFLGNLVTAFAVTQAGFPAEVQAASTKQKVAVGAFEGSKRGDARAAFIDALKQDGAYEVTDAEDVKGWWSKPKAMADAASGLGVSAVIIGKFGKGGLKLKVLGADGKVVEETEIKGTGAKLKTAIGKEGPASVAQALAQVAPKQEAPAEEEAKAEDGESEAKAEAEAKTDDVANASGGLSPLDITVGLRALHRTFDFHDTLADVRPAEACPAGSAATDCFAKLPSYELPLGPVLFIDLNWFPASHFTRGAAEWFGLTGGFEKGLAIKSVYQEGKPDEQTLKTNVQGFYAGARFRLPIGPHQLGATGTFGQQSFGLDGDEARPRLPDVKYTYVKAGLEATIQLGDVFVNARVGKRFVLGTGALEDVWFSNVKTQSLEAGGTIGYRLLGPLDLVAGFDWLRYAFDFNPVQQSSHVAGGAVDQYLSGYIGLRFRVPGAGAPEASTPAAEPAEPAE